MARGVAQLFGSDYAVSSTGYAEASPETGIPVPFAHVAIWKQIGGAGILIASDVVRGPGLSRTDMQQHVAVFVLSRLQNHIESE